jgi:hypothetical protein
MTHLRPTVVRADLLAETNDADAVAVRLERPPRRPIDGKHRRAVVYCAPDLEPHQLATMLRDLANQLNATTR